MCSFKVWLPRIPILLSLTIEQDFAFFFFFFLESRQEWLERLEKMPKQRNMSSRLLPSSCSWLLLTRDKKNWERRDFRENESSSWQEDRGWREREGRIESDFERKGSKRGIFCRFRDTISFSPFLWFRSFVDTTFQVTENKTMGNKNSVRDMRTKVSSKDKKKKTRTTTTDDRQTDWTKSHHKKKEQRRECHKKRLFSSLRFFFFLCINKKWKHNENSRMNFNDS